MSSLSIHRELAANRGKWTTHHRPGNRQPNGRRTLRFEPLEDRALLSVSVPGYATPDYMAYVAPSGVAPLASSGPTGYTPAQIRAAYGFNNITFSNGTVAGNGSGTTIAIVDAYNDPNIASDLHQFDQAFGLSDPVLTKVSETGSTTNLPTANSSWATEISLDVEWAHAIAPGANILLVEANSASMSDLMTAVSYASHASGVVAVSMSWSGGEFSGESAYDSYFTTPSGHGGVTFVAASGDSGSPPGYPAISPNVLSAGGTTLNLNSSGGYLSESGWSGSGGGISAYESQPSYQKGVVTQSTTYRTNPDVAYDANPSTGFPVYDSYGSSSPWGQWGGTSDAAPQWAALIAIADQGRALTGEAPLDGATQTLPMLYALPSNDFHDITSGTSTGHPNYTAGVGYDLVTGRGTPIANLVVAGLVGSSTSTSAATHFSITATPSTATAGQSFSVTVTALNSSNNAVAGYVGTVHFTSSDSAATLPSNYTFTSANAGSAPFSVTLVTAGNQTITVADAANASILGTVTLSVSPAAASRLAFGQQPTSTTSGSIISPAVTVQLFDAYGNLATNDKSDQVSLSLASNTYGGTLSGTTTATVSGGVATFSNLSISQPGTGYILTAAVSASSAITPVSSVSFNVSKASVSRITPIAETSSNWSGYAVAAPTNSVSYVAGSWVVPAVNTNTNGYSAVWVGIDGYSSSTVEQIGTAENVANGQATYYAWYEMYPSTAMITISMTVKAGDSITGSVAYNAANSDFVLTINDVTESETFTKTLTASRAARSSAEWIVEAPSSNSGILPLANFGTVAFANAYATISGATGPIDNWQAYSINMASRSRVEDSTSALSDSVVTAPISGTVSSFTVTYTNAAPARNTVAGLSTGHLPADAPAQLPDSQRSALETWFASYGAGSAESAPTSPAHSDSSLDGIFAELHGRLVWNL